METEEDEAPANRFERLNASALALLASTLRTSLAQAVPAGSHTSMLTAHTSHLTPHCSLLTTHYALLTHH